MTGVHEYFPAVSRWRIPASVVGDSYEELARYGQRGTEGIALWAGKRIYRKTAEITHVLLLRGVGIWRHREMIRIAPALMNDVTDMLEALDATLIGQIHSHAPGYGVDLSSTDRHYGINVPYYLSVVAPDFAMRTPAINQWGVHVYEPVAGWRRLTPAASTSALEVIDGVRVPVSTVGCD